MIYRMLEYSAFLRRKYELTVKQFVFYIGQKKSSMQTEYADEVLSFKFNLVSIRDIPYQIFLNSDKIEEVILSILADFENDKAETIITKILEKLKSLATEKIILERSLRQLEIISKLRELQNETVKQIEAMPIIYDLKTDIRYLQGVEAGIKESQKSAVTRALMAGKLSLKEIADFLGVTIDFVKEIQSELKKQEN